MEAELGNFNVLIGPNASGKSNFVQIFRFIKEIIKNDISEAVDELGGSKYFLNGNINESIEFKCNIEYNDSLTININPENKPQLKFNIIQTLYSLYLNFKSPDSIQKVDHINSVANILDIKNNALFENENISFRFDDNGGIDLKTEIEEYPIFKFFNNINRTGINDFNYQEKSLLRIIADFFPDIFNIYFKKNFIFNFNPNEMKKQNILSGKKLMHEDGSNLLTLLHDIFEDEEKKRKFFNILNFVLPFIKEIETQNLKENIFLTTFTEEFGDEFKIPANYFSDGTINILAMIAALYFQELPLVIMEEPEKNIHPALISKVVEMMKDASKNRQVIITTHNPEIVKHAGPDSLLFVHRDDEGFSTIRRPANSDAVKEFMKDEIGLDELYIHNFYGV